MTTESVCASVEVCFRYGADGQSVQLSLTAKEPESLSDQLKRLTEASERQKKQWEADLKHLNSKFELRDAGHGETVRCIDMSDCTSQDLHQLLRLSVWTGEPLIVKNVRGAMDRRPQVSIRVCISKEVGDEE